MVWEIFKEISLDNELNILREMDRMTSEQLLYKSEGVKDCVKWIEKRIKEEQKFNDSIDRYYNPESWNERNHAIKEMISIKISLEKYAKKLKHEANEISG